MKNEILCSLASARPLSNPQENVTVDKDQYNKSGIYIHIPF